MQMWHCDCCGFGSYYVLEDVMTMGSMFSLPIPSHYLQKYIPLGRCYKTYLISFNSFNKKTVMEKYKVSKVSLFLSKCGSHSSFASFVEATFLSLSSWKPLPLRFPSWK